MNFTECLRFMDWRNADTKVKSGVFVPETLEVFVGTVAVQRKWDS